MTELRLRIVFDQMMLGPGKAELLGHIQDTGSISAAGRRMGMSYKRAWSLVEEMNAGLATPAVHSARGGAGGGGAQLTATGVEILGRYRAITARLAEVAAEDLAVLEGLLAPADLGGT